MMIDFMTIIVSLFLMRAVGFSLSLEWQAWLPRFYQWVQQRLAASPPLVVIACMVLPVGLLCFVLSQLFAGAFVHAGRFGLGVLTLVYCLGADAFFHHRQSLFDNTDAAVDTGEGLQALIAATSSVPEVELPSTALSAIICCFTQQVFALLFWFAMLGPFGAWLYFSVARLQHYASCEQYELQAYAELATKLLAILLWLPARLVALGYVLAGDFTASIPHLQQQLLSGLDHNYQLLIAAGLSALGFDHQQPLDGSLEQQRAVIALSDRCLVLFLAVYALAVLFSFG